VRATESLYFPSPESLDLPKKFTAWRAGQTSALERALEDEHRFTAVNMPTGSGKSLFYMSWARAQGGRTAILTSTRGLQDQLIADFAEMGLKDIRGMANYRCLVQPEHLEMSCDEGPCHAGFRCDMREAGCLYFDAARVAQRSSLVVTNYSYWFHRGNAKVDLDLGTFDNLVLDEAHAAPEELAGHLSIEITAGECGQYLDGEISESLDWWKSSAAGIIRSLELKIEQAEADIIDSASPAHLRHLRQLKNFRNKIQAVRSIKGNWALEASRDRRGNRYVKFDPVVPSEYGDLLWRGVKRILLTSATIHPKTLAMLGVSRLDSFFIEQPSVFPAARRPIIYIPTVRVNFSMSNEERRWWVTKIDQIIDRRKGLRGIIHTVSYNRAKFLVDNSRHKLSMVLPTSQSTRADVDRFKHGSGPDILVSPAITTGFDFPGSQCRFAIIGKIPFPDTRSELFKARESSDAEYSPYLVGQALDQMAGRGMRSESDWCETFIVDDNIRWYMSRYGRKFLSRSFREAYQVHDGIPEVGQYA
jgi:ATP-dependent DNA helicase DinG